MKNLYTILINLILLSAATAQNQPLLIKDINSGSDSGIPTIGFLNDNVEAPAALDNSVVFAADDGSAGLELWVSDGTDAGTNMLLDLNPNGDADPHNLMSWGGAVYFAADDGSNGIELWKTDGTSSGTVLLKDISVGATDSKPSDFTAWGDKLLFAATGDTGREIWVTDGTPDGTTLFKDVIPNGDSNPTVFRATSSGGFFFVSGGSILSEGSLMYCDGTPDGITQLAEELVDLSAPDEILVFDDKLYFTGVGGGSFNSEPWISDGTEAGTKILKEVMDGSDGSTPRYFTPINGKVLFGAGGGIWITDGTEVGTTKISDLEMVLFQTLPNYVVELNGKLIFPAKIADFSTTKGAELYESDGTEAGTKLLKDLDDSFTSSSPERLAKVGNRIFFAADTNFGTDLELWESDGTEAGTFALDEINDSGNAAPMGLIAAGNRLFFSADDGTVGRELWTVETGVNTKNLTARNDLLEVFPNPATDFLTVSLKTEGEKIRTVEMKDLTGKILQQITPKINQVSINLSGFTPGIYLLQVNTNEITITEKVIISK